MLAARAACSLLARRQLPCALHCSRCLCCLRVPCLSRPPIALCCLLTALLRFLRSCCLLLLSLLLAPAAAAASHRHCCPACTRCQRCPALPGHHLPCPAWSPLALPCTLSGTAKQQLLPAAAATAASNCRRCCRPPSLPTRAAVAALPCLATASAALHTAQCYPALPGRRKHCPARCPALPSRSRCLPLPPLLPATALLLPAAATDAPAHSTATTAAATATSAAPADCTAMASLQVLAFDHEGRPDYFDTWLDDLQPYLLSDIKDRVSQFDHVSGAAAAPPTTADAQTSAVAVGATRGTPRPPFFEGCSPSPLAPSYASAAAADVSVAEEVGAASASAKRRSGKGKGGKGGGGGSGTSGGGSSGGGGGGGTGGGSGGSSGGGGGSGGSGGSGASGTGGGGTGARRVGSGGGQHQQQQRWSETQSPQKLREWFLHGVSGVSCPYVIRTSDHAGQTCGLLHTQHRYFSRLDDAWRAKFGDDVELPRWADLLRSRYAIFDLEFDAILSTMFAFSVSAEGDCYRCVPPDLGISAAALGASKSGQVAASCSCRLLSHQTLLWHHSLGHPSLPRLRGMHSRLLVSGLPRSLPPVPPSPALPCLPCVEGRQRATPHSSSFPPTTAPLQTLHMDVWVPARVSGQSRKRYFLLVVEDYTRYTTVFPLRSKGQVVDVLIPWILTVCLQLRERFGQDLLVLRLHSDKGGEFSSSLLRDFCHGEGILQSFMLPGSPQQNGIAERHIGLVMEVARTSMIHAGAPHFLLPFAVWYAAHQLNLWPRVSLPETSPTLHWTGEVGDASVFRYVTFDESVPFYRLFPYRSAPPPPPPLFLAPGPPPVDPLSPLSHMVHQVLQRFGFLFSSPQPTPLSTSHSLSAPPSDESVEPSGQYPELVGCLMYLMTCTRPDLAYPLSLLARYVAPGKHRKVHWDAAKRVLCYLCSTSGMGLVLGGRGPVVLTGHADAPWVDDLATQPSSQGYTFSLGFGSVSWRSTHSSYVLSSSCEAEIYAGAMAAQELRWLTYLLSELGEQPRSPPVLYVDNKAIIALCHEHRLEHRTKHIALRYFLARELQQRGQLRLAYMATRANTADIFTKALPTVSYPGGGVFWGTHTRGVEAPGGVEATCLGACDSASAGAELEEALHTFTLNSGASRCFFRNSTTVTPLTASVPVTLVDPSRGPVVARGTTVLPCPAAPSSLVTGLHLPSFAKKLVATSILQDQHGSGLYTLITEAALVAESGQVAASIEVVASCSCRLLTYQTLLWHHRLGHPSLPRLRGMHSRLLMSGLPRSLPPLPRSLAPPCLPCVEGRQRAAPHSSLFPPTTAPLQTLHIDVWGPPVSLDRVTSAMFFLVVDDYTHYSTVFPLQSKANVRGVLIRWIYAVRLELSARFRQDLPVLRLHSDRGGEFSSHLLDDFCGAKGICQSFMLPASREHNGIVEHLIGLVMEVACTSMIYAAAPHFLWPFAVRYATHQLNLWPRVSVPETSPTQRWTGRFGDVSGFWIWGSLSLVRDLPAGKLSQCTLRCVFLGFPTNALPWKFYHPGSRRVPSFRDVTFDE
ncbi:unnamed protein product [Closterium sp. NIES-54]